MVEGKMEIFESTERLADGAAALFIDAAAQAIEQRDRFCVALSGGTTPKRLYQRLAAPFRANSIDWSKVFLFWGDERHVPTNDAQSNYAMVLSALIDPLNLAAENIFPVPYNKTPEESAEAYEATLHEFFGGLPRFDLVLLGLGTDGHTASLFPQTAALAERNLWVREAQPLSGGPARVTLTYPVLNNAETVCFLVAGADKAPILDKLGQSPEPDEDGEFTPLYPADGIRPVNGRLLWYVDRAARPSCDFT